MILLDGKKVAKERNLALKDKINHYTESNRAPQLSIILVGDNPASISYVTGKGKACKLVGINHTLHHLEDNVTEDELVKLIEKLNQDDQVDGILLQLPIPKHLNDSKLIDLISRDKDADGFHVVNQGYLYQKKPTIYPATPKGIISLLEHYNIEIASKHAVIIGRSNIVGFPVARLLMDRGATITVCHRQTKDLSYHTKQADIIIASAGTPLLIKKEMVKEGAIVVDVGVNRLEGKLVGDVCFDEVQHVASYLSPVLGGVGPMTINALLENTFELYLKHIEA